MRKGWSWNEDSEGVTEDEDKHHSAAAAAAVLC